MLGRKDDEMRVLRNAAAEGALVVGDDVTNSSKVLTCAGWFVSDVEDLLWAFRTDGTTGREVTGFGTGDWVIARLWAGTG